MWEIEGRYRGDGYGERGDEMIERKLREAYECGYEDARREMRGGYGERGGEYGGDEYSERRGRSPYTGRYVRR